MRLRLSRVPLLLLLTGTLSIVYATVASSAQRSTVLPPQINGFYPAPVTLGKSLLLSWSTANATAVSIDQGFGSQPLSGSITVSPIVDTDYTLTATGPGGSASRTARVTVVAPPPAPVPAHLAITALPQPLVLLPSTQGSTSYTISNNGGQPAAVTITQQGTFFSGDATSFTLSAGNSRTIIITTAVLTPGTYQGAALVNVQGDSSPLTIPVLVLVVAAPAGPAVARASENRVDLAVGPEATIVIGSTTFINPGGERVTALVTSDVPWMKPDQSVATIDPGQTVTLGFTIDRSRRPDASALQGSARCGLILTYLSGPAPAAQRIHSLDGSAPPVSITTVTIVDTVKPATKTGGPAALADGEVAIVLSGAGHVQKAGVNFVSDLAIVNATGTRDLKGLTLFHLPLGGTASSTPVTNVAAAGSVTLVDVTRNVFNNQTGAGSLQIRGAEAANITALANLVNLGNPAGAAGAPIPPFRSDRAATGGQTIVLTGLAQDDSSLRTDVSVQEMVGAPASARVDYYDAAGSPVGNVIVSLGPFGLQQLPSGVPSSAVMAMVTNDPSSAGRLQAHALRSDSRSGDGWTLVDWRRQNDFAGTGAVLIPVAGSTAGLNGTFFKTDVWITNPGSSPGGGNLRFYPAAGTGGTIESKRVPLAARETAVLADVTAGFLSIPGRSLGYLVFTPESGTNAAVSARTYTMNSSGGSYSSGVPVVNLASALKAGQSKRFGALDDASPGNVAKGAPATSRTNLGLVETSGNFATIKVSLSYDEVQSTFSVRKVGEQTFSIGPNEAIFIRGLSNQLIGKTRASFGDLRNIQLRVEVLSGQGSVVPFTSSVDNGTGDATVRVE